MNSTTMFPNSTINNGTQELFSIYIWPFGILVLLGGLGGLFGNAMIVLALVNSKELKRNRCNIFVANLALADFISCLYFVIYGINSVRSLINLREYLDNLLTNEKCFFINIPAVLSFNAGSLTVLAIGLDRMTALTKPLFYKNLPAMYTVLVNGLTWSFGLINVIIGWIYKDSNKLVPACVLPTAMNELAASFWNNSNIVINILVVASYTVAYKKAKALSQNETSSANNELILRNNRLLTSLIVFVFIYILGWMVTMLVIFAVTILPATPTIVFHCSMYVGVLANVNVGCNFYIYYTRSDEYRKIFRKLLGLHNKQGGVTSTQVMPFSTN